MDTLLEKMAIQGFAPVDNDPTNKNNVFLLRAEILAASLKGEVLCRGFRLSCGIWTRNKSMR